MVRGVPMSHKSIVQFLLTPSQMWKYYDDGLAQYRKSRDAIQKNIKRKVKDNVGCL